MDTKALELYDNAFLLRRVAGIAFGFANQILFLITVWFLFWFLKDGSLSEYHLHWFSVDAALAILFAVTHSAMLYPSIRRRLSQWIPREFYDSFFCVVTCLCLLVLFVFWRSSDLVIWRTSGVVADAIRFGFYGSWAMLFYSLWLTGLGYQNGWTPFYHWLRHRPQPKREFKPRGAYLLIRHPVYLSFLGLLWFSPQMTLDRFSLTLIWTAYIFYGSFLKDQRLAYFIGAPYLEYSAKVAGYPFVFWGPLARKPQKPAPSQSPLTST